MNNLNRYNFYLQTLADLISMLVAYTFAFWWKFNAPFSSGTYTSGTYMTILPAFIAAYIITAYFLLASRRSLTGSLTRELESVTATVIAVISIIMLYVFFAKISALYSREFTFVFCVSFWIIDLIMRMLFAKIILHMLQGSRNSEKLILIGSEEDVRAKLPVISQSGDWRVRICGIIIVGEECSDKSIDGIEILDIDGSIEETILATGADSVYIVPENVGDELRSIAIKAHDLGKTVYMDIEKYKVIEAAGYYMDSVGGCSVMSYHPVNMISKRNLFIKRLLDLIFGLLFLPVLVVVAVPTVIFTCLESPGPILIRRIRVGKNGRRFNQYRFRTLRMDAEERIQAGKNPRTVWGSIIYTLRIDRMPMLLNVIFGDMSFVGPHAPRLARYLEYGAERRKNLSIRPGCMGRWGFSNDENRIIEEERSYIEKWNLIKDIHIIIEFIIRYLLRKLNMRYEDTYIDEELRIVEEYKAEKEPLVYNRTAYIPKRSVLYYIYLFIKRVFDIVVSLVGIVVLSPLFLILIVVVMADDGGSPFYAHLRVGKNGRRIRVYKFRTMGNSVGDIRKLLTPEQLEQYRMEFKIDDDPRITTVGRFLRRTSLDELPQLFNILGGSLSLIGPRPVVEDETELYGDDVAKLLSIKPGLTGYWQAYARNNATYETGDRQLMEMYYVDNQSMWLDIRILFKTVATVISGEGAQ